MTELSQESLNSFKKHNSQQKVELSVGQKSFLNVTFVTFDVIEESAPSITAAYLE